MITLLVTLTAISVTWALISWRKARTLRHENAWLRRRLADEAGSDAKARIEAARALRAVAVKSAELGRATSARWSLDHANEIERGGPLA